MNIDLTEVPYGDLMEEMQRRDHEQSHNEALHHIRTWIQKKTPLHLSFDFPDRDEKAWEEFVALEKADTPGLREHPFKMTLVSYQGGRMTLAPAKDRPPYQAQRAFRFTVGDDLHADYYSDARIIFTFGRWKASLWPWSDYERFKRINAMTDEELEAEEPANA
jgi:hypothetical protein